MEKRLIQAGIEAFLSLHLAPCCWSDRIKLVEIPLYLSYIYLYMPTIIKIRECLSIQGVSRVVYCNGAPEIIFKCEIAAIRSFFEHVCAKELSYSIDEEV